MLRDTELERLYQLAAKAWARTARALDDWRWRRAEARVHRRIERDRRRRALRPLRLPQRGPQASEPGRAFDARQARDLAHHAREDLTRTRRDA